MVSDFDKRAVSGCDAALGDVLGERGAQWKDTYKVIGKYSEEVLGLPMTVEQFCSFMILLKLTRYSRSEYKERDCLVDIIGYAKLVLQDAEH